jgi:hypothetical protein
VRRSQKPISLNPVNNQCLQVVPPPAPQFHELNENAKLLIRDSIDAVIVYIDSLFPNERFFGKIGSCYQRRLYARTCLANTTYPKDVYVHEFSMVIHALFTTNKAGAAAETYELRYLHGKGRGLNQRGLVKEESFNIAEELQHGTQGKNLWLYLLYTLTFQ